MLRMYHLIIFLLKLENNTLTYIDRILSLQNVIDTAEMIIVLFA